MTDPGVFTVSFDTELAWGSFDKDSSVHESAYRATPAVVDRLCTLLDDHDVGATWALVAHLFGDCDGEHASEDPGRRAWLDRAPCATGLDRSLWYAPSILERIQDCETPQEVGLHGYSHMVFDEHGTAAAREELTAAVAAADHAGVDPASFVFPRNRVAHTDLFAEVGLSAYRARDARWYEHWLPEPGRKPFRFVDELLRRGPPTVVPRVHDGVVAIPGSQLFRPDHGPWGYTPRDSQRRRALKGLEWAAGTGRVFHLWCHPFNLARNPDRLLGELAAVFERAATLRDAGRLETATMAQVAELTRDGRWDDGGATDAGTDVATASPMAVDEREEDT